MAVPRGAEIDLGGGAAPSRSSVRSSASPGGADLRRGRGVRRALLGLGVAGLLLAAAEGLARLTGLAPADLPRSPLLFQRARDDLFGAVAGGRVVRFGRPRALAVPKVARRVYVLGESAVEGDGFSPTVAFPAVVQRLLGPTVEVVNGGTPGLDTIALVSLAEQVLAHGDADALVIYAGNNQLHRLRALKTVVPGYDARAELARRRLGRLALYRLLRARVLPERAEPEPDVRTRWPSIGELRTPATADDHALAVTLYAEDLDTMRERALAAGVPFVVVPPVVNLSWADPQGGAEERAAFAEGQAAQRAGDLEGARAAYWRAVGVATRPNRATPGLRDAARDVAGRPGATLCDVDAAFPLPGDADFADACHLNPAGHARLAAALAPCLAATLGVPLAPEPRPDPASLDAWTAPRGTRVADDGSAEAARRVGHAAFTDGDLSAARAAYTRAGATYELGLVALQAGDLAAARRAFAASEDPASRAAAARLAPVPP